ncbi:MAG: hypothetical protein V4577_19995 [Bacteroidota bacterium]
MKKMFLSVLMAVVMSTAIKAQTIDTVTFNGFTMVLHGHKVMKLVCRPQRGGYIDSSQVKVSHSYTYASRTEFYTETAIQKYTEAFTEKKVKITADVSVKAEYGPASGEASAGLETDYTDRLTQSITSTNKEHKDVIQIDSETYKVEYEPHKAIQLYECVVSVAGEYQRIYASPKVPNKTFNIPYTIVIDYSNAPRALYQIIQSCNAGTDTGEWSTFNNIGYQAYTNYTGRPVNIWTTFLTSLRDRLWTDGSDQDSWAILKNAAINALGQKDAANQLRIFCSQVKGIYQPAHNEKEWGRVTDFARRYDN